MQGREQVQIPDQMLSHPPFDQATCGLGHLRRPMRRSEGRVGPRAEAAAFGGHAPLAAGGDVEPFL
jgi:hypothetical protein